MKDKPRSLFPSSAWEHSLFAALFCPRGRVGATEVGGSAFPSRAWERGSARVSRCDFKRL